MPSKPKTTATKEEEKPALVPKLRFPEFRGADGWKEKPLGRYLRESRIPGSKGNVARKLTVKLWGNGVFEKKEAVQGSINTQYFRRRAGQFIYSKLDFLNQAFGIVPEALDGFESTVDLPCFDISEGLNPVFLLEYVKRKDFYERVGEAADGSRKAKRIQVETLIDCLVTLPTPAEQQKIAECLSSVDEVIAAQARKLDALKTQKKGLMQQLFPREGETQPRLRFPEFQYAGAWEEKALADIVQVASGQVEPTQPPYSSFPQIGSENIEPNTGKLVNVKSAGEKGVISGNYLFDEHDVLYSKIRPALNKVAAPDFTGICSADIYPIRPANDALLRSYLLFLLLSDRFLEHAIRSSDRGKIPKINREDLLGYVAAIPKPPEQHRIAKCLSSLDALIAAETQKHAVLQRHKRGLMQQLFPSPEEVEP